MTKITRLSRHAIAMLIAIIGISVSAYSQGQQAPIKRIVQVSGLVVTGPLKIGVPGVLLYIPKAGRGTTTSDIGFFSLATTQGDSMIISALGYKRQYYRIPEDDRSNLSIVIHLVEDTLQTSTVEVLPYPTEELFKQHFLTMKLPEEQYNNMRRNLNPQTLKRMSVQLPMDGTMNQRFMLAEQARSPNNRMFQPTISLFNPFAWVGFINSVRRGDLKKKPYQKEDAEMAEQDQEELRRTQKRDE